MNLLLTLSFRHYLAKNERKKNIRGKGYAAKWYAAKSLHATVSHFTFHEIKIYFKTT